MSFEIYHPEMEWGWSDEFPDLGGVYRDPADPLAVNTAAAPLAERPLLPPDAYWRVAEPDDFLEIGGDHVVVLTRYVGRGRGSGIEIQQEGAHVFGLRDGKVIRLEIFASRARALEYVRAADAASET